MAGVTIDTKADLLRRIESSWPALDALLNSLTETQMTTPQDQAGWTVKDHLIHLALWEDSVTALFQGKPRYQALGIDESTYSTASIDEINALIRGQRETTPLHKALEQLRSNHRGLMAVVERLSDTELNQQARELFPLAQGSDQRRLIDIIYANSAEHFEEHRGWIERLVAPE